MRPVFLLVSTVLLSQIALDGAHASDPCVDPLRYDVCKSIGGTNGWAQMTNCGAQSDSFGCAAAGEETNRCDSIVHTAASAGNQSWHFKRGYDSPGTGTACSPSLGIDEAFVQGGTFKYAFDFKSADPTCNDGSRLAVVPAPCDCSDLANEYMEIQNLAGHGTEVRSFFHGNESTWDGAYVSHHATTPLQCGKWHRLQCQVVEKKISSVKGLVTTTCSVDDTPLVMGNSYYTFARNFGKFPFVHSCRLKFRPRHPNYASTAQGFYFDNLVIERSNKGSCIEMTQRIGFETDVAQTGKVCKLTSAATCANGDYAVLTSSGKWGVVGERCPTGTCGEVKQKYIDSSCCETPNGFVF